MERSSWAPVVTRPKKMCSDILPPSIMHIRSISYAKSALQIHIVNIRLNATLHVKRLKYTNLTSKAGEKRLVKIQT